MKRLVDIDESALSDARASLGTVTIKDTVNMALRRAADAAARERQVSDALTVLAELATTDDERRAAWS